RGGVGGGGNAARDAPAASPHPARRAKSAPHHPPRRGEGDRSLDRPSNATESEMNKITRSKDLMIPKVTTGPISASSKVYAAPEGHPDIRVPFREIALSEGAGEKSFRVYDPSGPYTD